MKIHIKPSTKTETHSKSKLINDVPFGPQGIPIELDSLGGINERTSIQVPDLQIKKDKKFSGCLRFMDSI